MHGQPRTLEEHRRRLADLRSQPEGMESGVLDRLIRDLEARIEVLESRTPTPAASN